MGWLVVSIIWAVLLAGCGIAILVSEPNHKGEAGDGKIGGIAIAAIATIVWLIISFALSLHTVSQRQVGVVSNFSGTITGSVHPGVVMTWPWQSIEKQNVGVQREDFILDETNAAVSSDQQPIYASLSLNYQVEPRQVVNLYKSVGPQWKAVLLDSRVLQDFKEVTSQYSAREITTKREQLRADTRARLSIELAKYDIHVVDFFVKNIDYTASYKEAISAKNVQVQKALQAEAKVVQARAEAAQQVALANGQAQSIRLKGSALRDNPSVLQLEAIDKLSPNVTTIICTGKTCPSFLPQSIASGTGK